MFVTAILTQPFFYSAKSALISNDQGLIFPTTNQLNLQPKVVKMSCRDVSLVYAATLALSLMLSGTALSQQNNDCPKRLGVFGDDRLASETAEIMAEVYQNLGCPIEMISLPGRRGFRAFNNGTIDGELYRLPVGAKNYIRSYVQSETPLFEITNSLWVKPDSKHHSDGPIGYIIGVAWQEAYLETNNLPGNGHHDVSDMIWHYNAGIFNRFLAEDTNIIAAIRDGDFGTENVPIQLEVLEVGPLYHFLGAEFSAFMARLSEYVKTYHPFTRENAL